MKINILFLSIVLLIIIVVYPFVIKLIYPVFKLCNNISDYGQFGEMYGILGSVFSGLALIGIIVTYYQENKKYNLERKERDNDKKENNEKLALQKDFDNFFALLNSHLKIIESSTQGTYSQRACIAAAIEQLEKYNNIGNSNPLVYLGYITSLRAYFRSLIIITKYIKYSAKDANKEFFKKIIFTHLLGQESAILNKLKIEEIDKSDLREMLDTLKSNDII